MPQAPAVAVAVDGDQPPDSQGDAVLEVQLPKAHFDAGEVPTLGVRMHTRGGKDLRPSVEVEDLYQAGIMDRGKPGPRRKGTALDNRPGDHSVTVWADALDEHGNSVHRATVISYSVATGDLKFIDVGSVHPAGPMLVVPLKVVAPHGGVFVLSGVLATATTAVARADTTADLKPGVSTVELRFALAHIYEAGPYHLTNVFASITNEVGATLAAAPQDVGGPFQAPHVNAAPPPLPPTPDFSGPPPPPFSPTPIPPGMNPVPPAAPVSR